VSASLADFTAIAGQVDGASPSAIRAIAQSWTQAASSCGDETTAVQQATASAADGWTGLGEQSFEYSISQFSAASRNQQECLQDGAKTLNGAADALENAQGSMNGLSEDLSEQLRLVSNQAAASGVSPSDVQAAQEQIISDAVSRAQGVADEAGQALGQASSALEKVLSGMKGSNAFSALYVPTSQGFTPQVSAPGDAGNFGNEVAVAMYLVEHGYSKAAAAGVAACIAGESLGSPEAVGSGGWGLIGWTPQYPGQYQNLYPTGNESKDFANQVPAILAYNSSNGNVAALNSISDPVDAAKYFSQTFERPLVTDSDVRADVATSVYKAIGG
jgi:uncharacterized protein YukE